MLQEEISRGLLPKAEFSRNVCHTFGQGFDRDIIDCYVRFLATWEKRLESLKPIFIVDSRLISLSSIDIDNCQSIYILVVSVFICVSFCYLIIFCLHFHKMLSKNKVMHDRVTKATFFSHSYISIQHTNIKIWYQHIYTPIKGLQVPPNN